MVQIIMDNRTILYHHPDLVAVSANHGNLINGKIQAILRKFVAGYGFENEDVVGGCISKMKRSPKKHIAAKGNGDGATKKRKRAKREQSDEDDWEEVKPSM